MRRSTEPRPGNAAARPFRRCTVEGHVFRATVKAGLDRSAVLDGGIDDWEGTGFDVDRGAERWDLERQVRLVAGSVVLSSILGTCAMGTALSKLPYNRNAGYDPARLVSRLGDADDPERAR